MSQKLKQLKEKLRRAIKQELIEYDNLNTQKEEELEESSMTGNMDGGEGPPQTPYAFQSKKKRGQDKTKEDEISTNSTGFVKMNEGRYHDWRNDESITPKQKIGRSMREVRDSLNGLSKTIDMSVKLKTELKVDSKDYWKTTNKALTKISERLVKLANKVGRLQWDN